MSPQYLLLLLRAKDKQELFADILTSRVGQVGRAAHFGAAQHKAGGPSRGAAVDGSFTMQRHKAGVKTQGPETKRDML